MKKSSIYKHSKLDITKRILIINRLLDGKTQQQVADKSGVDVKSVNRASSKLSDYFRDQMESMQESLGSSDDKKGAILFRMIKDCLPEKQQDFLVEALLWRLRRKRKKRTFEINSFQVTAPK